MKHIQFYYYGIDKETGNKKKFMYCFFHAVKIVIFGTHLETEVIDDDDFVQCEECGK